MKKVVLLLLASCFYQAKSQDETDMSLKINNAKMSFYANSIPPTGDDVGMIDFGIRLWELGKKEKWKNKCCRFGICGDQSIISPPSDFTDEGRQVSWKISSTELSEISSVNVYFRENVSEIAIDDLLFNVNQDVLIKDNIYFQSGSYQFDSNLGEFGGFTIKIVRK